MIWVLLLVLLIAVVGIGTVLKAALWAVLVAAAVVVVLGFLAARALGGRGSHSSGRI